MWNETFPFVSPVNLQEHVNLETLIYSTRRFIVPSVMVTVIKRKKIVAAPVSVLQFV